MEKETEDKSSQTSPTQSCHQHSCQPHYILFCAFSNALMPHLPFLPLFPFDFNKCPFQSPLFNPPVGLLSTCWFIQSGFRAVSIEAGSVNLSSSSFSHLLFSLIPFPPTLPSLIFSKVCYLPKMQWGSKASGTGRGCKKRGAGERWRGRQG